MRYQYYGMSKCDPRVIFATSLCFEKVLTGCVKKKVFVFSLDKSILI